MDTKTRREQIFNELLKSKKPISASTFAKIFSVSRQVIVGDIGLLRASGKNVVSTPTGYLVERESTFPFVGIITCKHNDDNIAEELYTVVDFGGSIIDVTVDHAIYGEIRVVLNISSRYEANVFLQSLKDSNSLPLSFLSDGLHRHTVGCKDEDIFNKIHQSLLDKSIATE